jgi:hypothetical protein
MKRGKDQCFDNCKKDAFQVPSETFLRKNLALVLHVGNDRFYFYFLLLHQTGPHPTTHVMTQLLLLHLHGVYTKHASSVCKSPSISNRPRELYLGTPLTRHHSSNAHNNQPK